MQQQEQVDVHSAESASNALPPTVKMKLPNGKYLLPDGSVVSEIPAPQVAVTTVREIQSGRAAARTLERVHRKLGDLPQMEFKQLNAVATIVLYSHIGLNDEDIAQTLGTSIENVQRVKELDAYKQLAEMFDTQTFEGAKKTATHLIAKASGRAAEVLIGTLESRNELNALAASKEVLRMNGVSTEQTEVKKSGLNIKIVRKGESTREETLTVEIE